MIQQSESVKNLNASLALAQGEIENAVKNAANPHFKNRYADLAEIINTVRPVFSKYGLAVVQFPSYDAEFGVVGITTHLTHSSGEWLTTDLPAGAPTPKKDPQGVGSAITYLRRYALAALANIAQEDDDGEAATRREAKRQQEHDDLLRFIGGTNVDTPDLKVTVGGTEVALSAYLKKHGGSVKGVVESARELVRAIEKAQAAAVATDESNEGDDE